jgi:hypothetical protein
MKKQLLLLATISSLFGGDYDFDFDAIEVSPHKYSGYIKAENKHQIKRYIDDSAIYLGEIDLRYSYIKDKYKIEYEGLANYEYIDAHKDNYTNSSLYLSYTPTANHTLDIGKKSLKWGKGYFANPIAFLDRQKDPNNPEASREGYTLLNYKYNKSLSRDDLKNYSFDIVVLKADGEINQELATDEYIALKLYLLYLDTDIDFVYMYAVDGIDKVGVDFSTNIETNFELHGEVARYSDNNYSLLAGLKYLTENDLTITSEYIYKSYLDTKDKPLYDRKYLINKLSQKEPLDILYSSLYYKNMLNLSDNSHQNSIGFIYSFDNNIELDISYNINIGTKSSQFGSKVASSTIWSKIKWSF